MRDAEAKTIRLSEYRPPDYLIDEIALVFSLDPQATLVAARNQVRRTGEGPAPLELHGERLELQSISIDGEALRADQYRAEPGQLVIENPPAAFRLDIVTRISPAANTRAGRPLHVGRPLLHAVRSGRLPRNHLCARPPGRAGALCRAHRGR